MQINSYVSDRQKKRKRRRRYFFAFLGLLALYLLFFIVQWFIFHSPIFRVDTIVVQGNTSVASSSIVDLVEASALPKHGLFPEIFSLGNMIAWPNSVPASELQLIPELSTLSISKDYFAHTVTIKVTQRVPFGIWCFSGEQAATSTLSADSNAQCYWFDDTGTIFEKSFDTQGNLIFVVYDTAQTPRGLNQKVLSDDFLPNAISIMDVLHQSGLGVKAIELNNLALEEMDVLTTNGPEIYFSLRFSADDDLPVIQKLMLLPNFDKLQYIDCRTDNRIFYK